jgi:hypothetical protein
MLFGSLTGLDFHKIVGRPGASEIGVQNYYNWNTKIKRMGLTHNCI